MNSLWYIDVEVEYPQLNGGAKAHCSLQLQQSMQHRAAHVLGRVAGAQVHQASQHVEAQPQLEMIQRARGRRRGPWKATASFHPRRSPQRRRPRERRLGTRVACECLRQRHGDDEEEPGRGLGGHGGRMRRRGRRACELLKASPQACLRARERIFNSLDLRNVSCEDSDDVVLTEENTGVTVCGGVWL
ncbi:hypothetical protein GW17_00017646 [Ensete ventricosum]|uniref:Uncharacterized protein n=1 Tax=Ensete ventricosum TaxID=4639 RepID=A0A444F6V4_ENSVE|nr:hypothetical protein B296_00020505 [Ensete ventricosum]RWW18372.1 hypothetical protein GW17_00017646 [Ensete ventricosum]